MRAPLLGNYPILSLQLLDGNIFILNVLAYDLEAVIKTLKLKLLLQLDSKLVDIKIGNNGLFVKFGGQKNF